MHGQVTHWLTMTDAAASPVNSRTAGPPGTNSTTRACLRLLLLLLLLSGDAVPAMLSPAPPPVLLLLLLLLPTLPPEPTTAATGTFAASTSTGAADVSPPVPPALLLPYLLAHAIAAGIMPYSVMTPYVPAMSSEAKKMPGEAWDSRIGGRTTRAYLRDRQQKKRRRGAARICSWHITQQDGAEPRASSGHVS